jgi:hypothetical protein
VVARTQLIGLGLGRGAIEHRLAIGRLHVLHSGIYAFGHPAISDVARWLAAVLACGPESVLSHRSAAALWGLRPSARPAVEVIAPRAVRRPGIEARRARVPTDEVALVRGIRVTSVPRTLLDLAAILDRRQVARAVEQAEVRRLTDPLSLPDLLVRYPHRRGVATIRAILAEERAGSTVTRSELEERFLDFCDGAGLPRPRLNVALFVRGRWLECDRVWRAQGVIVELDGRAFHATAAAFERDRARDRVLQASGWLW